MPSSGLRITSPCKAANSRNTSARRLTTVGGVHWVNWVAHTFSPSSRVAVVAAGAACSVNCGLLRKTPLPIGEIADRVGYTSQSAFAAAMLREFGASPGALRRSV